MFPFFRKTTDEALGDRLNLITQASKTAAREEVMSGIHLYTLQAEIGINFLH